MTKMTEDIISTDQIYDGHILQLNVHQVRLPDGTRAQREVLHHPGAVAMVALDNAQNVVLVKQFRSGSRRITLEIPAGLLEPDEDPQDAIVREMREETGYRPQTVTAIGGVYPVPGISDEYIHLFYGRDLVHDPLAQDDEEFIEVVRLPIETALAMIDRGEINEGKTTIALLRIARRLGI